MSERRMSGQVRYRLLRELASGTDHNQLADRYDRSVQTIRSFAERNADVIAEIRTDPDDEVLGLWIANRYARVAEYQTDVEEINEVLERLDEPNAALLKAKHSALKNAAEELGQLQQRIQAMPDKHEVTYKIEGVDPQAVR